MQPETKRVQKNMLRSRCVERCHLFHTFYSFYIIWCRRVRCCCCVCWLRFHCNFFNKISYFIILTYIQFNWTELPRKRVRDASPKHKMCWTFDFYLILYFSLWVVAIQLHSWFIWCNENEHAIRRGKYLNRRRRRGAYVTMKKLDAAHKVLLSNNIHNMESVTNVCEDILNFQPLLKNSSGSFSVTMISILLVFDIHALGIAWIRRIVAKHFFNGAQRTVESIYTSHTHTSVKWIKRKSGVQSITQICQPKTKTIDAFIDKHSLAVEILRLHVVRAKFKQEYFQSQFEGEFSLCKTCGSKWMNWNFGKNEKKP